MIRYLFSSMESYELLNSYFIDVVILNGGIVVDTFFVLSGFLTCHYILQELDKYKRFNFLVVFLNRWIRQVYCTNSTVAVSFVCSVIVLTRTFDTDYVDCMLSKMISAN
ncbi:hypothetical protein J6590_080608 [Homalodisca vitripennis]|nr:hypothetical protein J6590_080608 [Homalodisca vitripennis]